MSGRVENDMKIEATVQAKLMMYPEFLTQYSYSFTNSTAGTKRKYVYDVANFLDYQAKIIGREVKIPDLRKITKNDINKYLSSMIYQKSDSTRAGLLSSLRHFWGFLSEPPFNFKINPCLEVKRPKDKKEHPVVSLTPEEIKIMERDISSGVGTEHQKAYQQKWKKRDVAILTLGCRTGLRVSAITELDMMDIDWENQVIQVTEKGNVMRSCYVGSGTLEILKEWIDEREKLLGKDDVSAVFISDRLRRITSRCIYDILRRYSGGINKHITPHKMRSTCATNLYAATGDVYLVQQTLGHKNIENTKRYTAISEEKKRKASQIMDSLF